MSQAGASNTALVPSTVVETLTGNSGGAVGPDAAHNINVVGTGSISVAGNPGTNTLTISSSGGGNFVLIQQQTISGQTNVIFNTGITSTYSTYLLTFQNFTNTVTSSPVLTLNSTSATFFGINFSNYNTATLTNLNNTSTSLPLVGSSALLNTPISGYLYFYNLPTTNTQYAIGSCCYTDSGSVFTQATTIANWALGAAVTTITIARGTSMGTISGLFSLYGIT